MRVLSKKIEPVRVENTVTVQQVCAFTALTVRKRCGNRHKSICITNLFVLQILHGFVLVTMRGLNSYKMSMMTHWKQLIFFSYKIRKKYVIEASFIMVTEN